MIDRAKPVHLVINPKSGYGGRHHLLSELRARLHQSGYAVVEYTTTAPEDAACHARALAARPDEAGAVVVWGGDGTANEVANGLVGSLIPMLVCPVGTENLLATELRMPSDPRAIVEVLSAGRTVDCDVGRVNGRNFLMIIGVGFDGEVVRRMSAGRTGHISHLSYFWPIWRTFWEHDFPRMRVFADGRMIFDDYGLAFVGNISRYAVGLRICRDARYDDGLLDLVLFTCREQTALLWHAAWTLLRRHPLKGNVVYRPVRMVRIETDQPVPSQVDGDPGPLTPLEICVNRHAIKLAVPQPRPGWVFWPWTEGAPV